VKNSKELAALQWEWTYTCFFEPKPKGWQICFSALTKRIYEFETDL